MFNKKKRLGYYKAFLKGIELSKGEIIFFSDTGNKYDYKKFIQLYKIFKEKNADLISCYRVKRQDKILRQLLTFFYTIL